MKVLYHHRIRSKDGQYVHVEELIRALRALGHEIEIVGPSDLQNEDFGSESSFIAMLKQRIPKWMYECLEFAYCCVDFAKLVLAIRRFRPQVIYERFNLFLPSGIWAQRLFGIPLFLEVNAPLFEERSAHGGIGLPGLARWTQHYAWRGAAKCFPVTDVLADYLRAAGVPEDRIEVVPNGINESMFGAAAGPRRGLLPASFEAALILGFVGFVRSWHGLDSVISLVAERKSAGTPVALVVVGDGPARASLEEQARVLAVADRVHFTGVVARDAIRAYIELFDIALQPKVVPYASPLKLFEYLAMGRAIVAPNMPNITEVLTDGENALLFDPDEPASMKNAIARLANDAALRQRVGAGAAASIEEGGYTWKRNAERVTRCFEEALAG